MFNKYICYNVVLVNSNVLFNSQEASSRNEGCPLINSNSSLFVLEIQRR